MLRPLRLCAIALLILAPSIARSDDDPRPNFVVIIADDMAWNDCGAYGHPNIRTPNIDRLAAEGMKFTNAFLTCSSCSPSRSSINTGRYPHATGAPELHMPLPAEQVLFTTPLREAGYFTAACGKWHMGGAVKSQYDVVREGGNPAGYGHWLPTLRERPLDKPFFFWLATTDPHRGYQKNTIDEPHTGSDAVVPPYLPDVPEVRDDLAMYYDEIGRLDLWVGKVMAELEAQGVADNTLVLFMSDNGRPFPRCKTTVFGSGVRTPFIVRWPKGVEEDSVTSSLVSSVDIAPTFCQLAGAKILPSFQGKSFVPVLENPEAGEHAVRSFVFSEHNWHDYMAFERGVRNARYQYVFNALPDLPRTPPADAVGSPTFQAMRRLLAEGKLDEHQLGCFTTPVPREQLFAFENDDPHELRDVSDDPNYAAVLADMRAELAAWQERTGDHVPAREALTPDKFDRETGRRLK